MLETEAIIECDSIWSTSVVLVPKPTRDMRVSINYRELNAITKTDKYPLPRVDNLLYAAKQCMYLLYVFDNAQSLCWYWQIIVREENRDKTYFVSTFRMFRFLEMPFSMRNTLATFRKLMDCFNNKLSHLYLLVRAPKRSWRSIWTTTTLRTLNQQTVMPILLRWG